MMICRVCRQSKRLQLGVIVSRRNLHGVKPLRPFDILFLGRDEFSCLVLSELHSNNDVWKSITVATSPDTKTGRNGSQVAISPLKNLASELRLSTHFIPPSKSQFRSWMPPLPFNNTQNDFNALLVTASFGRLIPNGLLHIFPESRRLNVHPSLLPLYRGPAPIQHTLADGKDETGVCIIEMKEKALGADVGEIWASANVPIPAGVAFPQLRDTLAKQGGQLLVKVLREMISGTATALEQDNSRATCAPAITQETARIDFSMWTALKVDRMHRAISHQKPLTTVLPSGKALQLHDPQIHYPDDQRAKHPLRSPGQCIYDAQTKTLFIRCAEDTFIKVSTVQQQDRKALVAKEWWNGVRREWLDESGVLQLGVLQTDADDTPPGRGTPFAEAVTLAVADTLMS